MRAGRIRCALPCRTSATAHDTRPNIDYVNSWLMPAPSQLTYGASGRPSAARLSVGLAGLGIRWARTPRHEAVSPPDS